MNKNTLTHTCGLFEIRVKCAYSNTTVKLWRSSQEKFEVLRKIKNNLTDVDFEIVEVGRELLKEGKMTKISARSGEKQDRYLYLVRLFVIHRNRLFKCIKLVDLSVLSRFSRGFDLNN